MIWSNTVNSFVCIRAQASSLEVVEFILQTNPQSLVTVDSSSISYHKAVSSASTVGGSARRMSVRSASWRRISWTPSPKSFKASLN